MLIKKELFNQKISEFKGYVLEQFKRYATGSGSSGKTGSRGSSSSGGSGSSSEQISYSKIDNRLLKECSAKELSDGFEKYMANFESIVNAYLTRSGDNKQKLSDAIKEVLRFGYGVSWQRIAKFSPNKDFKFPEYPASYKKMDEIFWNMTEIRNLTKENFYNNITLKTTSTSTGSSGSGGSGGSSSSSQSSQSVSFGNNALVEKWLKEISEKQKSEIEKFTAISDWLRNNSDGDYYLTRIFSDMKCIYSPTKEEITKAIYIDTNLLVIIMYFGLNTFLPDNLTEEEKQKHFNRYFL